MFSFKFCKIVKNMAFYITPPFDCFFTFNSIVMLCKIMGSASAGEMYDKCTQNCFLWTCFATTLNYFHKNIWWQVTGDLRQVHQKSNFPKQPFFLINATVGCLTIWSFTRNNKQNWKLEINLPVIFHQTESSHWKIILGNSDIDVNILQN